MTTTDTLLALADAAVYLAFGTSLIEYHDQAFKSQLKDILAGDNMPNVSVSDERMESLK